MTSTASPTPTSSDLSGSRAVIIGAGGGIGSALVAALRSEAIHAEVVAFSRGASVNAIDITDEASIIAAAAQVAQDPRPVRLVLVASGLLHDGEQGPEKAMAQIDAEWMMRNLAVNAMGPVLVAKHFVPLLPRDGRSVFAALGARVGSIADNQSGGWISYRMAKAALVMGLRTIAIEQRRRAPRAIIAALHPGTVDTRLSAPFGRNLPPGQKVDAETAALRLLDVIDTLKPEHSGHQLSWDGTLIPG